MDDIESAIKRLRASTSEREQKQLAQLLCARAVGALNRSIEDANKLSEHVDEQQQHLVNRFFRWRLLPLWMVTVRGAVILAALGAVGAFVVTEPLYGFVGSVAVALVLSVLSKQAVRAVSRSMFNSTKYTPGLNVWQPPCAVCVSGAGYTLNVPRRGETLLCSHHSEQLRSVLLQAARPASVKVGLRAALRDAEEAVDLDPDLAEARALLERVYAALSTFQGA